MDSSQLTNLSHSITRTTAVYCPSLLWFSPSICLILIQGFGVTSLLWNSSLLLPRVLLFSLIWVLPFLSFPFRGKKWVRHPSNHLKTPLSTWASVLDHILLCCTWSRLCSRPLTWAVVFRVCMAQVHWLGKLLCPPSRCVLASLSPCHSPHSIGKPSLVLQHQAYVLPSPCIQQPLIECSVL